MSPIATARCHRLPGPFLIVPLLLPTCSLAGAQCLEHVRVGADAELASDFGSSVALDGNVAVVGARRQELRGAVYIYRETAHLGRWIEEQKVRAIDTALNHEFGSAVAVRGGRILVGAPGAPGSTGPLASSGAAYFFRFQPGNATWVQEQKMVASDAATNDMFGTSVALEGNVAVIGAVRDGNYTGAAYVFRRDPATGMWRERVKLVASDATPLEFFGHSVAIAGDWIWVGAYFDNDNAGRGTAYAFRYDPVLDTWTEHSRVAAYDLDPGDAFGFSVAASGNEALIGAPHEDDQGTSAGAVYAYRYVAVSDTWFRVAKLFATDAMAGDRFGNDVALRGEIGVLGTFPPVGGTTRQAAYVFGRTPLGFWREDARVTTASPGNGRFGAVNDIQGERLLAGAPGPVIPAMLGAVHLVELDRCPLLGTSYCGPANPNSSGAPAMIHALGTGGPTDPLLLLARDLPMGQFGFFITSQSQNLVPNPAGSQGNLCLGVPLARFTRPGEIQGAGPVGAFELAVDTGNLPTSPSHAILAGETWNFTAWYRDDNPGPTSNFTNGVSIDFQ